MSIILIVFGSMLMAAAIASVFVPRIPGVLMAYAAACVVMAGGGAWFDTAWLIWWAVAAAIATALQYILPRPVALSRVGLPFMGIGAIAGGAVGIAMGTVGALIIAIVAGILFGAVAYADTAAGREQLAFPTAKFFNYVAAKGLPMAVTLAITGSVVAQLITLNQ